MKLKGIIFDHDGTLVDTEKFHYQIWREVMQELDVDFPEHDYIRHHSGVPSIDNAKTLISTYTLAIPVNELLKRKEERTQSFFKGKTLPLMNSANECIQFCLNSPLKVGVATGANRSVINRSLGHHPFFAELDTIATADDVEQSKPAPDVYQLALDEFGLEAQDCIAIEDSPTGIASAKAAGLICIAIANDYSQHQDLSQADLHLDDLSQVIRYIEERL